MNHSQNQGLPLSKRHSQEEALLWSKRGAMEVKKRCYQSQLGALPRLKRGTNAVTLSGWQVRTVHCTDGHVSGDCLNTHISGHYQNMCTSFWINLVWLELAMVATGGGDHGVVLQEVLVQCQYMRARGTSAVPRSLCNDCTQLFRSETEKTPCK